MNAPLSMQQNALMAAPSAPLAHQDVTGMILNPQVMQQLMNLAEVMSQGISTVPDHLRGKPGDCLAVVLQAAQWNMNPFAVAQKTHLVNGRLGYEAQLVHAVLEQSGAIQGTFKYEYKGMGDSLECRVGAVITGEREVTWGEWLSIRLVTTKNSPLWKTNPKQQMGYLQVKNWARAFKPGAILGVYTPDELATMPTPKDMGNVEHVIPDGIKEAVERFKREGAGKADQGATVYGPWWKALGDAARKWIVDHLGAQHDANKKRAYEVDQQRTVDAAKPTQAAAPAAAAPAQTEGDPAAPTHAQLVERMQAATTTLAVEIAAEWIDALPADQQEDAIRIRDSKLAELAKAGA